LDDAYTLDRSFPPFTISSAGCVFSNNSREQAKIDIDKQCQEDLCFLLFVLGKCHQGINLNLIAF
jgi:hypothetical protein